MCNLIALEPISDECPVDQDYIYTGLTHLFDSRNRIIGYVHSYEDGMLNYELINKDEYLGDSLGIKLKPIVKNLEIDQLTF